MNAHDSPTSGIAAVAAGLAQERPTARVQLRRLSRPLIAVLVKDDVAACRRLNLAIHFAALPIASSVAKVVLIPQDRRTGIALAGGRTLRLLHPHWHERRAH